jgi:hypothetical protein
MVDEGADPTRHQPPSRVAEAHDRAWAHEVGQQRYERSPLEVSGDEVARHEPDASARADHRRDGVDGVALERRVVGRE